jgi:hypothetical protein
MPLLDGVEEGPVMLARLLTAHEAIITEVRAAIEQTASNGDGGTNDLLMGDVLRTHEQQVWGVAEHLVETPLLRACHAAQARRRSIFHSKNGSAGRAGLDKRCQVGLHLFLIHEWRLEPHDLAARPAEEHIAAAEQVLGASGVEHDARVCVRGDAEGDPCVEVGLERRGDDIGAGALGGEHEVDAHRARGGREDHQILLERLTLLLVHHADQQCVLVDQRHDRRQRLVGVTLVEQLHFHAAVGDQILSPGHLTAHQFQQGVAGLVALDNHLAAAQVGHAVEEREVGALRVDDQQLQLARRVLGHQAEQQAAQEHRLARVSRPGDEQVWELREILDDQGAVGGHADHDRQLGRAGRAEVFQERLQHDQLGALAWGSWCAARCR